ncbi:MAG TPA: hypothetical protein VGC41_28585 [Kofleriaceae bacterium]
MKVHRDSDHDRMVPIADVRESYASPKARAPRWGGKRAGAGRPKKHAIASEPHKRRPAVDGRWPLHVVARTTRVIADRHARRAIESALHRSLARSDFRIVHLSIRGKRIELVIEAGDREALARGMQGFQVSAARALNRVHAKVGRVFSDRYRARALITRAAVRAVIVPGEPNFRRAWPETTLLFELELPPPPTPPPRRLRE